MAAPDPQLPQRSGERHRNRATPPPHPTFAAQEKSDKATLFVDHCRISSSRKIPFEADPRDLEAIKTCVYFHNNGE